MTALWQQSLCHKAAQKQGHCNCVATNLLPVYCYFFFIGSQVSPTPSFLNILWSTSDSITVE